MMKVSYQETKPSPMLKPFVDSYWFQRFEGEKDTESPLQKCLPLGMVQIIIHLEQHECLAWLNNEWKRLPDAFCVGLYKEPVTWKTKGAALCFGINLKPESFLRLFKVPVASLFNHYTDLDSFLGSKVQTLAERMYGISDEKLLVGIAEDFLKNHIRDLDDQRNYLYEATRIIRQSRGSISIEELSRNLYVSERQLQRTFKETLGTSPKTYTRIIRFRNAYEYVQQVKGDHLDWTEVCYNFGYSDQAHFIRDFKEFTGAKPTYIIDQNCKEFYQLNRELVY